MAQRQPQHPDEHVFQAYRQLYDKCLAMHGKVPNGIHQGLEFVEDRELARHYMVKKAFRATGLPTGVLYLNDDPRKPYVRECHHPYDLVARRYEENWDSATARTVDGTWRNVCDEKQPHPVESGTENPLPTMFSFLRPIHTYYGPYQRSLDGMAADMREWLKSKIVRCSPPTARDLAPTWTQLAPLPTNGAATTLLDEDPWRYSRESYLRLDLDLDLDLKVRPGSHESYVFCSQIARLPTGEYVPWRNSEEQRLAGEGYFDYNYKGPYKPSTSHNVPQVAPPGVNFAPTPKPPLFSAEPRSWQPPAPLLFKRHPVDDAFSHASPQGLPGSSAVFHDPPSPPRFDRPMLIPIPPSRRNYNTLPSVVQPRAHFAPYPANPSLPVGSYPPPPPPVFTPQRTHHKRSSLAALLDEDNEEVDQRAKRPERHGSFGSA